MDAKAGCASWADALAFARGRGEEQAAAVLRWQAVLGERWRGWAEGHQLAVQFFFGCQGRPSEGVRLARLLTSLDGVAGVHSVAKEVGSRNHREFKHGVMALEVAAGLRARGATLHFIQRTANHSPDMEVVLIDRPVIVEFKALHEPDDEDDWNDLWRWLVETSPAGLSASAFDMDLEAPAIENREALLEGLVTIAANEVCEYTPLPLGIGRARLAARNVGLFSHPGTIREDVERIDIKLRDWTKQIEGREYPTVILVHTRDLYRPASHMGLYERAEATARHIAGRMRFVSCISAMLLYEDTMEPPPAPIRIQHPFFEATWGSAAGVNRAVLFVPNGKAATALRPEERLSLMADPLAW
jgi:hypothetical protein